MKGINLSRVLLAGLAAGLVIDVSESVLNMSVLGTDMQALLQKTGASAMTTSALVIFCILGFILGIVLVWLYAAARTRFGPGSNTATKIAVAAWVLAYVYPGIGGMMMGIMSTRSAMIGLVWQLVELIVAANVGGYLYKEATA